MVEADAHARRFLARFYPPASHGRDRQRPVVTLTFAQSLDAKIAGPGGRQVAISGQASLVMTHVLRTLHDAILVGVGTLLNDNPQLNARQLAQPPPVEALPVPVVLDRTFRTPVGSKVLLNAQAGRGKAPLIIGSGADTYRAKELEQAGAHLARASTWPETLRVLQEHGLRSVMVEGGARVISSLLSAAGEGEGVAIDYIIITIGKTMLGSTATGYEVPEGVWDQFEHVATEEFGEDTVVVFRPKAKQ